MQGDSLLDCQLGLKHRSVLALTLCFFLFGLGLDARRVCSSFTLVLVYSAFFFKFILDWYLVCDLISPKLICLGFCDGDKKKMIIKVRT